MSLKVTRLAATLVLSAFLLSACGSSPSKAPEPSGSPAPSNTPAPTGPVKLVIGAHQDIQHFDIHNHNYTFTEAVHQHIFDYLVYFNLETGKFDPGLAKSWSMVNDTTWEFKLVEGVKFSNGDPFTAEDVKFTLERVSRDSALKEYGANRTIKEVKVIDPLTAHVITDGPDPILLNRLSRIGSGMLPAKYFQAQGVDGFNKKPIGTGGYTLVEWVKDDHVTLKAWDGGWRGKAQVDEIVYRVIPETQTRVSELVTGGVDVALSIGPDDVTALKKESGIQVYTETTPRVYVLRFRVNAPYITADKLVREAIDLAIDDKALADATYPGLAVPTRTRLVPGVVGYHEKLYNTSLYDLAKAKQLLEQAGFTGGKQPEISFLARNNAADSPTAQTIAGMLEKAGFKVNLKLLDPVAYTKEINAHTNEDLYLTSYGNSMKDGDLAINFVNSAVAEKHQGYNSKKADDLLAAQAKEMDPVKRVQLMHELDNLITSEEIPQIALFQVKGAVAVRQGVNWAPRPDEMHWFYNATKGK